MVNWMNGLLKTKGAVWTEQILWKPWARNRAADRPGLSLVVFRLLFVSPTTRRLFYGLGLTTSPRCKSHSENCDAAVNCFVNLSGNCIFLRLIQTIHLIQMDILPGTLIFDRSTGHFLIIHHLRVPFPASIDMTFVRLCPFVAPLDLGGSAQSCRSSFRTHQHDVQTCCAWLKETLCLHNNVIGWYLLYILMADPPFWHLQWYFYNFFSKTSPMLGSRLIC